MGIILFSTLIGGILGLACGVVIGRASGSRYTQLVNKLNNDLIGVMRRRLDSQAQVIKVQSGVLSAVMTEASDALLTRHNYEVNCG